MENKTQQSIRKTAAFQEINTGRKKKLVTLHSDHTKTHARIHIYLPSYDLVCHHQAYHTVAHYVLAAKNDAFFSWDENIKKKGQLC